VARLLTLQYEGRGATAEQANEAFTHTANILHVPPTARNVDYFARFQGGTAAFDVSETEFLAWSKRFPWKLTERTIDQDFPLSWQLRGFEDDWPQDVRRVLYFSNSSHRGGWTVMYDRDHQRAYVCFSPR
jgi:hypothetical protein